MALTQVVEHHLPTYVSLALVWLKVGVKTCMKFEKMKVHHIAKTTKHTSLNMQHPDSKKQRREANCEVLENPLQPILCFFFQSHCKAIKLTQLQFFRPPSRDGGGWVRKTTTLWDYSGRRNWFLRITYICPDEQKVSTIEAEGTWPIPFVWNCHNNKHLAFEGQINKVEQNLWNSEHYQRIMLA